MSSKVVNIIVPILPESVADATVAVWHKKVGDEIKQDELLIEIETDKIMLEVPAPNSGQLASILEKEGSIVLSGQILGSMNIGKFMQNDNNNNKVDIHQKNCNEESTVIPVSDIMQEDIDQKINSPVIRKLAMEHDLHLEEIKGSGVKGRITRQDIEEFMRNKEIAKNIDQEDNSQESSYKDFNAIEGTIKKSDYNGNSREETRVPMNRLRKRIAERLLDVTNTTAMLTTFNEINMQPIIDIRKKYGELFKTRHNTKLGLMSFYVKAVVEGLLRYPEINASIDGSEIVYYHYFDISIAVATDRGLVTPVLRNANKLSMFEIEKNIKFLAEKGRNGKLTIEDLSGGNFTITNGGIFGSLLSTPIINPPQSAILGMHAIKDRPIALHGQVEILPMMYLALSYDHRLIDGKNAVSFLVNIKELLEDPVRLILDI